MAVALSARTLTPGGMVTNGDQGSNYNYHGTNTLGVVRLEIETIKEKW